VNDRMEYEYYSGNVVPANFGQLIVWFKRFYISCLLFKVGRGVSRDMFGKKRGRLVGGRS
jgi:hypothetical protein